MTLTLVAETELDFWLSIVFVETAGLRIVTVADTAMHKLGLSSKKGEMRLTLHLPRITLLEGEYSVNLIALRGRTIDRYDQIDDAVRFRVMPTDLYGVGRTVGAVQGIVHLDNEWLDADYRPLRAPSLSKVLTGTP